MRRFFELLCSVLLEDFDDDNVDDVVVVVVGVYED